MEPLEDQHCDHLLYKQYVNFMEEAKRLVIANSQSEIAKRLFLQTHRVLESDEFVVRIARLRSEGGFSLLRDILDGRYGIESYDAGEL